MERILRTSATVRPVTGTREAWLSMDHVTPKLRSQLLAAQVLLGPTRWAADGTPQFPENTITFYRELRSTAPSGVTVDLLQEDEHYREWVEHDFTIVIPDMLVNDFVLGVVCGLLSNWIFHRFPSSSSGSGEGRLRFKLYGEGKVLEFEGPPAAAPEVLRRFAEMEDVPDVTHLLELSEGQDDPNR